MLNAIVTVQRIVRLVTMEPPLIGGKRLTIGLDELWHFLVYFYKVVFFVQVGIQIPQIELRKPSHLSLAFVPIVVTFLALYLGSFHFVFVENSCPFANALQDRYD